MEKEHLISSFGREQATSVYVWECARVCVCASWLHSVFHFVSSSSPAAPEVNTKVCHNTPHFVCIDVNREWICVHILSMCVCVYVYVAYVCCGKTHACVCVCVSVYPYI